MDAPTVYLQKCCPLCRSIDLKPVKSEQNLFPDGVRAEVEEFNKTWVQLLRCNNCGFGFLNDISVFQ